MNFWQVHGIWFIVFLALFPRLTMLVTGIFSTMLSPLFFLGWLFLPRLTVAIIATTIYWHTNPVLCVITWIWALSGEGTEKTIASDRLNH